jgi:dihydroflavonol-4-reductase
MKVLVTGASGFLGGYVIESLRQRGHEVLGAVRRTSDTSLLRSLGVTTREMDLEVAETMRTALQGMDAVVHLAAYYTFTGKKALYQRLNVDATKDMLDASLAEGVTRFLYCSSTEAMGPVEGMGDEGSPMRPRYEYGRSKAAAEKIVNEYGGKGLSCTILRPSGVYGPRNVEDVSYWFITSYGRSFATKFVVGDGQTHIQFVHAKDVAQGFARALENERSIGQCYIISGERSHTYEDVYRILGDITGIEPPRTHLPAWLAKMFIAPVQAFDSLLGRKNFLFRLSTVDSVRENRSYSIAKAQRDLGYSPEYDLRKGLEETVQWYRQNGYI